jgi:hypothetical protein
MSEAVMTTFIFMLSKSDGAAAVERVLTELAAAFPEHEFLAGDADIVGYENSILAMHGCAGSGDEPGTLTLPDPDDVAEVNAVFRQTVKSLEGWKPS